MELPLECFDLVAWILKVPRWNTKTYLAGCAEAGRKHWLSRWRSVCAGVCFPWHMENCECVAAVCRPRWASLPSPSYLLCAPDRPHLDLVLNLPRRSPTSNQRSFISCRLKRSRCWKGHLFLSVYFSAASFSAVFLGVLQVVVTHTFVGLRFGYGGLLR